MDVTFEGRFGGATYAVAASGNYAYIGQGQDLVVLDVSNPASPVELGRVMTSDIVRDVAVSGDYAYVADSSNGLLIVDVSSKSAPTLAGSYDTAGSARDVAVSGDYAYVADVDNGLVILRSETILPISKKGDLNSDDQITSADAVIALTIAAGGSASCDPAMLAVADVSGDNRVTSLDALMILQAADRVIEL